MPFVHEVSFDIASERADELKIGASLQRTIGFLRSLLPNERGFVMARGMYSIDRSDLIHVSFHSVWHEWDDLVAHLSTGLTAEKVLQEFGSLLPEKGLTERTYEEIA